MYTDMEWGTKVRLEVTREGKKKRKVLRDEGIGWGTLKKILAHPEPPGYRLKEARPKPKIGAYLERIAQIIEEDKALPKKQRHTAKRIYERIREMGYGGKYTQVKEVVRKLLRMKQEVFMPLVHRVGEAQVDFGYALAKVFAKLTSCSNLFIAICSLNIVAMVSSISNRDSSPSIKATRVFFFSISSPFNREMTDPAL